MSSFEWAGGPYLRSRVPLATKIDKIGAIDNNPPSTGNLSTPQRWVDLSLKSQSATTTSWAELDETRVSSMTREEEE